MFAHLVACGMTWDQARHDMDLPRLEAMNRYWEHSPPVHVLVARYLGIKAPAPAPKVSADDQAAALMNMIDQGLRA